MIEAMVQNIIKVITPSMLGSCLCISNSRIYTDALLLVSIVIRIAHICVIAKEILVLLMLKHTHTHTHLHT